MAADRDLRAAADALLNAPLAQRLLGIWRRPRVGPALRSVGGLAALYGLLEALLRHNEPPPGIYVYGVIIGLLYALLAVGLILIYRATRIINFAQAEMGATSAVLAVLLIKVHHYPYLLAFGIALGSGLVAGMLVELLVVRRFAKASRLVLSVATIGIALIFAAVQLFLPKWVGGNFIVNPSPPKTPFSSLHFNVGHEIFDGNSLVVLFWVAVVIVGLAAFFKLTDIGIAVRGSAENADRAALLGVPVKRVSTVVWMLAAVLSSLSIFLRIPVIGLPIGVFVGPVILLYGLGAAVIARMEHLGVAVVAGIALGVLE